MKTRGHVTVPIEFLFDPSRGDLRFIPFNTLARMGAAAVVAR
jgi:hypothetical protein